MRGRGKVRQARRILCSVFRFRKPSLCSRSSFCISNRILTNACTSQSARECVVVCVPVCVCVHVVYVCHACRIHLASALPASAGAASAAAGAAFQLSKQKYKTLSRTNVHFN